MLAFCRQPITPYVPPSCENAANSTVKLRSITDLKYPRPCQIQPRLSDRKYRPWSWEIRGARFWPWLTIERYVGEELRLRHDRKMPHRRPLWPPEQKSVPVVYAVEHYRPARIVPVRETCCTERPRVCPPPPPPLTYANFVNWQWI
jgi:hypothetical protein